MSIIEANACPVQALAKKYTLKIQPRYQPLAWDQRSFDKGNYPLEF